MKEVVYKGYRVRTKEENAALRSNFFKDFIKDTSTVLHESSLLDEIFACDPVTGNPNSDLFFKLNHDPSIQQYIDKELQGFYLDSGKTDDKDLALETTRSRYETISQYAERLRTFISQSQQSE